MVKAPKPELNKNFKRASLGCLVIAPYYAVRGEILRQIITVSFDKLCHRMRETHHLGFIYDDQLVERVASRCTEVETSAPDVNNILTNNFTACHLLVLGVDDGGRPSARECQYQQRNGRRFVYAVAAGA